MKDCCRQHELGSRATHGRQAFPPTLSSWFVIVVMLLFCFTAKKVESAEATVNFSKDIRPILSDNCFHCHGPDPSHREADLRLDIWDSDDDYAASGVIVAGDPEDSELISRIYSDDTDIQMPPIDSGKTLSDEQKTLITAWIEQGAHYEKHWAFVAPSRPQIPRLQNENWVNNPIDSFVMARLESEGLHPSPQATPLALLRRSSLDLIGLTPTIEEIEEFESLSADEAYEKTVNRLLVSPHFGEKWAREWLDAARYADSDGYEKDLPRNVWMYRNWVIDALNNDMPYDEFLVEQIAGDLLTDPTQDELIATGFMRNSMTNREGGIDPEEFRMEAMFDRMDAIGKSVLGLTVQCAQCHTHKYDPITHTDYYRMFAFINNCDEAENTVYTEEQRLQRQQILREIEEIERDLQRGAPDWKQQMSQWEKSLVDQEDNWTIVRPDIDGSGGQKHYLLEDGSILAQGYAPPMLNSTFKVDIEQPNITAIRLELLNDPNLPRGGPGRSSLGLCALSELKAVVAPISNPQKKNDLKFVSATADVNPARQVLKRTTDDESKPDRFIGPVELAVDEDETTAWGIDIGPGRSNVPREAVFVLEKPIKSSKPLQLSITLVQSHGGKKITSARTNNLGRFRLSVSSARSPRANPIPPSIRELLQIPVRQRTPAQVALSFQLLADYSTCMASCQRENKGFVEATSSRDFSTRAS